MARFTPILGDLSGKLAGNVFARNKGGAYVRGWVKPLNPKTLAQNAARALFGNASQSYHSILDTDKANWQAFATTFFNPKVGVNTGQFSGANAYVALRQTVNVMANNMVAGTWEKSGTTPVVCTVVAPTNSVKPPLNSLQVNVAQTAPKPAATYLMTAAEVFTDGTFSFTCDFLGLPPGGLTGVDLIDGNGHPMGFALYMSQLKRQQFGVVKSPTLDLLGFTGIPTAATPFWASATSFAFTSTEGRDPAIFKKFPEAGDIIQVKLYQVSNSGMQGCAGTVTITVAAPA